MTATRSRSNCGPRARPQNYCRLRNPRLTLISFQRRPSRVDSAHTRQPSLLDAKQSAKRQPYPPLQTLIAAAVLREAGHQVHFLDLTFERDFSYAIRSRRPDVVAVCEDNFNFLTKMCLSTNRRLALDIAAEASSVGAKTIVNSSDATDHLDVYLAGGFDTVIVGELDGALADICSGNGRRPVRRSPFPRVAFTSVRRGGPFEDLDSLPGPAWIFWTCDPTATAGPRPTGTSR